jgi:hypothetical protein
MRRYMAQVYSDESLSGEPDAETRTSGSMERGELAALFNAPMEARKTQ